MDTPEQSYFPGAKVRLRIRLEEFGTKVLVNKAPKLSSPKLKGVKDERAPLVVKDEPGFRGLVLVAKGSTTPGPGTVQQRSSDNLTHEVAGVIPKKATWKQNGLRTADTLTLTIRYQDMPVDPRVVRACAVSFYLGTVTEQEYAAGISGEIRGYGGESMRIIPDAYTDDNGNQRTNLRFQGWVDKWKVTKGEGEALIELECVDNTRLLEKQVRPPRLSVALDKPLDRAVAEYLTHFPQMEGLVVEYLPRGSAPPVLKAVLAKSSHVPDVGPPGGGGGSTGGDSETVLDYLTTVVGSVAHSMRIDGTRLIIQRATNLLGDDAGARVDDPYVARDLPSGRYPVRAFIYGRNILEYEVSRDFARKQPKNIEVRSYDPERKNVVVARYPEGNDQVVNAGPGDGHEDKDWVVVQVPDGVRDPNMLKQIANEIYATQGRQELMVSVKTKNLASFGGGNMDPDILDMVLGDAFEILENRGYDGQGTVAELEQQLTAAAANEEALVSLGFPRDFASAYATAYTNAGFQRQFKMKTMTVDWDIDQGVSFDLDGANYIVARVARPTVTS